MTTNLGPGVWFVRSNRGNGSYPITREGWMVVARFAFGMFGSGVAGWGLTMLADNQGVSWSWFIFPVVFAIGATTSAWYYITTARKRTNYAITVSDYIAERHGHKG